MLVFLTCSVSGRTVLAHNVSGANLLRPYRVPRGIARGLSQFRRSSASAVLALRIWAYRARSIIRNARR